MAIDAGYTITAISGKDGTNGQNGASLSVQYSVNGTSNWHDTFASGDIYMRQKLGNGSWSSAMKIVGEDGQDGADGDDGTNGTNTWYSSVSATTSTTSIALSTITAVAGHSVAVGDLIIANSLVFLVSAVGSTNATVSYKQNIKGSKGDKGNTGDTGAKGDKGDKGDKGTDASQIGDNLLKNSDFRNGITGYTGDTATFTFGTDALYGNIMKVKVSGRKRFYQSISGLFQSGKTYAYSFYAKADASVTVKPSRADVDNGTTHTITTSWAKYSGKITATASSDALLFYFGNTTSTVSFALLKLEEGSVATAWCPNSSEQDAKGLLRVTTEPTAYTTVTGGFTPAFRMSLATARSESGVQNISIGDVIAYSYNTYKIGYIDASYIYMASAVSIRGGTGATGVSMRSKGAWTASTDYVNNTSYIDVVSYNGSSYACKTSHTSGSTFDSSKWNLLADKGATGTRGNLTFIGTEIYNIRASAVAYTLTTASTGITSNSMAILVGDRYINSLTYDVWKCTTAGTASTAKWTYEGRQTDDKDNSNQFRFFGDGTRTKYNIVTSSITQSEVSGTNPFDGTSKLWKVTRPANVSASGCATPYTKAVKIESGFNYRYACYVKRTTSSFIDYFGARGYTSGGDAQVLSLAGASVDSAYFISTSNFGTLNRWYLVIGYVTANGVTTAPSGSGVYDMVTKKKVKEVTNFQFKNITEYTHTGTLIGYTASATTPTAETSIYISDIRFDKLDGTEPSLEELLNGDAPINVSISADTVEVLCGNGNGLASGAQSTTIKVYARRGSCKVATTSMSINSALSGVTPSYNQATTGADGSVVFNVANEATLGTGATATVTRTLSVVAGGKTFTFTITFKKVSKGVYLGRCSAKPSDNTVTVYTSTTELTGGGVNKYAFAGDYVSVIAGNDIGKIFMYNGASWVADNNVGHGTSAFSDLLMIPDSLPNDSSSELILKRLISEEVLAKRISALEVNFQKFVASFKESGDQVGDLCISMGKNPKNAIDEDLNFIIQSYKGNITKNTTDDVAVWKKEFCTNKSEENQIDFIMNGDIKLNGNINIGATSLYLGADVEELIKCNGNGTNSSNGFNIVSVFYEGSIYIFNAKANEKVIVSKWVYDGSNNPQFVQESEIATKGLVYYATVYKNNIYVSFSTGVYRYIVSAKTFTTITTTYKPYIMNVVNGLLNLSNDSTFAFYNGSSVITKTPWEDCVSWLCEFSQDLLIACNGNLNITSGSSYSTTRMAFYDKNFTFLGYQQIRGKSVTTKTGTSKTIGYATGIFASNGIIFSSIICSDESHMLVASYDCGKTWKELLSGGSFLNQRCFSDNNIIVLYSTVSVMYSTDGGKSFTISPLRYLSNYIFGGVCCAKIDNYNDILVPLTHEDIYNRLGFLRIRQRNLVENTAYHIIASSIKDINRPFGVNYYTIPGLSDFDHVYSVGDIVYNGSPAIGNFYKCLKSCKITEHGFDDTKYWQNDIGNSGYIVFSNGLKIQWAIVTASAELDVHMPLSNLDKSVTVAYAGGFEGALQILSYATCRDYPQYEKNRVRLWGCQSRLTVYIIAIGY